jgi:hydrogenase maturation protease
LKPCIIGIGQDWAGDDAVGLAVIRELRQRNCRADLAEVGDPGQLIELLTSGADPVVIVDALAGDGAPGQVLLIDLGRAHPRHPKLLSTHGWGVLEAIELARVARPQSIARRIFVLGVIVGPVSLYSSHLSPAVLAAVPRAAVRAMMLCARAPRLRVVARRTKP